MRKVMFREVPAKGFFCYGKGKTLFRRYVTCQQPITTAGEAPEDGKEYVYCFSEGSCLFFLQTTEVGLPNKKELRKLLNMFKKEAMDALVVGR